MKLTMSQAQFDGVVAKLKAQGMEVTSPSGVIEKMGVKASYAYDGEALTVDVLEKPFLLSQEFVEGRLREFLG